MKLKLDFVTNSSSTCYILYQECKYSNFDFHVFLESCACERLDIYGTRIYTFNKLQEIEVAKYGDEPRDWITKITGPSYNHLGDEEYDICKRLVQEDKTAYYVMIDRNIDFAFYKDQLPNRIRNKIIMERVTNW